MAHRLAQYGIAALALTAGLAAAPAPTHALPPVTPAGPTIIEIKPEQMTVNVMKNAMPPMPAFPKLAPKRGKVRGYVKDAKGHPLVGAVIGVRSTSMGGFYSGASAKSDASGYYEISVPWGSASFYCAGYTMDIGENRAAFGLHPADGEADTFMSTNGAVENWVLLPYGIADRDTASDNPKIAGNYYGGTFTVGYWVADDDTSDTPNLPPGSDYELTLTPTGPLLDGTTGRTYILRRHIDSSLTTTLYVNNVPVGPYRLTARLLQNGRATPLQIKETGPYANNPFGLEPKQGKDGVALTFRPTGAKANMATAAHGNWEALDITLSR